MTRPRKATRCDTKYKLYRYDFKNKYIAATADARGVAGRLHERVQLPRRSRPIRRGRAAARGKTKAHAGGRARMPLARTKRPTAASRDARPGTAIPRKEPRYRRRAALGEGRKQVMES